MYRKHFYLLIPIIIFKLLRFLILLKMKNQ
nr:MAG TPA: hypothetical protein [Bacteriophage sp.]